MSQTVIYALVDPREPAEIRYVGKTRRGMEKRRREHISESTDLADQGYRARWVRKLLTAGVEPLVLELQTVEQDQEDDAERAWIATLLAAGARLTNRTAGGDGLVDPSPEVIERLRAAALTQWSDPARRAALSAAMRGSERFLAARRDPEDCARKAERLRKAWSDPDYRVKTVQAITQGHSRRKTITHCPKGHEFTPENSGQNSAGYRFCRICLRAANTAAYRRRAAGLPAQGRTPKTHCKNGHEYTPKTTTVNSAGYRICMICRNASAKRTAQRRRNPEA